MQLTTVPLVAPGKRGVIWSENPLGEVRSWECAFTVTDDNALETHAFVTLDEEDFQRMLSGHRTFRIVFRGTNLPEFAVSGIEPEWSMKESER